MEGCLNPAPAPSHVPTLGRSVGLIEPFRSPGRLGNTHCPQDRGMFQSRSREDGKPWKLHNFDTIGLIPMYTSLSSGVGANFWQANFSLVSIFLRRVACSMSPVGQVC